MGNKIKHRWHLFVCCPLLTLAFSTVSFAQKELRTPRFWRAQAQAITDELVKDAEAFAPIERSILWARLADTWWQDDQERGHAWLQRAVEEVTFSRDQEAPIDRKRRIVALRTLIPIVARRDEQLNTRVVNELLRLTNEKDSQEENIGDANAEALVNAALAIVKVDPRRAAALGSQSLRIGRTNRILALLLQLRQGDSNLADALFKDALNTAQPTHDVQLLSLLVAAAFPKLQEPMYQGPTPSADVRTILLTVLVDGLLSVQDQDRNRASNCGFAQIVAPLLNEISRAFPQQAINVRIEISKCLDSSQRIEDALRDQPLQTVDDFLVAADQARTPIKAGLLLVRAAVLASKQNDFNRAIKILDSLSTEQREMLGDGWENVRVSFAIGAAINYCAANNYGGVQQVVAAIPSDLRPFVQIPVADSILSNKGDRDFAFALLEEARQRLAKVTQTEAEKSKDRLIYSYLTLVRLYALIDSINAQYILREAVAAINKTVSTETADNETATQNLLEPFSLPSSLLEKDPVGTRQAVSSIDLPTCRVVVRLSLLKLSLEKKRSTKAPPARTGRVSVRAQSFLDGKHLATAKMIDKDSRWVPFISPSPWAAPF